MHNTQNGGIAKKKKVKQLTRQQKVRQQQAMEKADALAAKLELKVADSKERAKKVKARAADWEELNEAIVGEKKVEDVAGKTSAVLRSDVGGDEKEWEDVEEDGEDEVELPNLEQSLAQIADEPVSDAVPAQDVEASKEEDLDEVL